MARIVESRLKPIGNTFLFFSDEGAQEIRPLRRSQSFSFLTYVHRDVKLDLCIAAALGTDMTALSDGEASTCTVVNSPAFSDASQDGDAALAVQETGGRRDVARGGRDDAGAMASAKAASSDPPMKAQAKASTGALVKELRRAGGSAMARAVAMAKEMNASRAAPGGA